MMTILLALVMAGFVRPSLAQMLGHHGPSADMAAMPMVKEHRHAMPASGCGKFCVACASACNGVILPAVALLCAGGDVGQVVFASQQHLGRGVSALIDPYPPRPTAQS